jgi:hypothetical protein
MLADKSTCTIVEWKRKCGAIISSYKKPPKVAKGPMPKNWDNKKWFEQTYEKMGLRAIALLLRKGNDYKFVTRRLKKYGIRRKTSAERTMSQNPCFDEGWLYYYYADRKDYLKWCRKENVESCRKGGRRLTLTKCAEIAGVSCYTITNWLTSYKMKTRDLSESQIGVVKQRKLSIETRRKYRDHFFKMYRNGTINMIMGTQRFSNGKRVDKTETINKRFNTNVRGAPARPQGPE